MNATMRVLLIAALLPLFADVSHAGVPGFTSNPDDFSDLIAESFETTGFPTSTQFGGCSGCIAERLILPGLEIYPLLPDADVILFEDCQAALPMETTFIGSFVTEIVVELTSPETRVGLDYSSQFNFVVITVETSDGGTHTFEPPEQTADVSCSATGVAGFVGYDTADPGTFIDRVRASVADGGIDNVRCSTCEDATPVVPVSWGTVKTEYR